MRSFSLAQNLISLMSNAFLLLLFSPWAVVLLAIAGLPGFIAETRFSNQAFQLFRWRSMGDAGGLPRSSDRARGSRQGSEAVRA